MTCISMKICGQIIYVGDKKYQSTPTWNFTMNGENWDSNLEVLIAKTDFGGYLWLALTFPQGVDSHIGGNLTIFLNDETTINCIDRNIRDQVDNKSITLYKLTNSEIEILKSKRIITLRFQVLGFPWNGKRTADNVKSSIFSKGENTYATEDDIKALFDK